VDFLDPFCIILLSATCEELCYCLSVSCSKQIPHLLCGRLRKGCLHTWKLST